MKPAAGTTPGKPQSRSAGCATGHIVRNVSTIKGYVSHVRRSRDNQTGSTGSSSFDEILLKIRGGKPPPRTREQTMLMREEREQIASTMRDWESLERRSVESIEKVKAQCANPLVCLVMDIIENDAGVHERLQEFVISSLEKQPVTLSLDEVGEVIELIREHTRIKTEMIEKVEQMLGQTKDKSLRIQEFLLKTLVADEKKHKEMLEGIEKLRVGLYPYWPH